MAVYITFNVLIAENNLCRHLRHNQSFRTDFQ